METNQTFGQALVAVKEGKLISREGWNGKNMFVFKHPEDSIPVTAIKNIKSLPEAVKQKLTAHGETHYFSGEEIKVKFTAYLCMFAADGSVVNGWLASQTDMLATDWCILD